MTYTVRTNDNRLWKRHVDQIRQREGTPYSAKEDVASKVKDVKLAGTV